MSKFSKYYLHEVEDTGVSLGEGGYATVTLGKWRGQDVAIKRLHKMLMGMDRGHKPSKAFRRFRDEFSMLIELSHPCIVKVHGLVQALTHDGCFGIVMELFPRSLKMRYEDEPPLTVEEEVGILVCVAKGIEYLHGKDILHRDVTANNVMCTDASAGSECILAKLIDLGVGRLFNPSSGDEESLSMNPGAERYMAPEVIESSNDETAHYGRPADIFSFAVTAVAMLTKKGPSTPRVLAREGRNTDLALLDRSHPAYEVVLLCIADGAEARPTASQLCEDLLRIQGELFRINESDVNVASEDTEAVVLHRRCNAGTGEERERSNDECRSVVADRDRVSFKLERTVVDGHHISLAYDRLTTENARLLAERRKRSEQLAAANQEIADLRQQLEERHQENATVSGSSSALASTNVATTAPKMEQVIRRSQLRPLWWPKSLLGFVDQGMTARCQRLFSVNGVPPNLSSPLVWRQTTAFPERLVTRTGKRFCVHEDHLYCPFMSADPDKHLVLYRCEVGAVRTSSFTWQYIPLPSESAWHHHAYCFSFSGCLHCILCRLDLSDVYQVFRRDDAGGWRRIVSLPQRMFNFGIAILGSTLVVVGGSLVPQPSLTGTPPDIVLSSVRSVHLEDSDPTWQPLSELPSRRAYPQVLQLGAFLHVLGGHVSRNHEGRHVVSMNVQEDLHDSHWSYDVLPIVPHAWCGASVVNGQLVVVGGRMTLANENGGKAYLYVPERRKFLELPHLSKTQSSSRCVFDGRNLLVYPSASLGELGVQVLSV